jgi:hypothetical protein
VFLPPELYWWIDELKKVNTNITPEAFIFYNTGKVFITKWTTRNYIPQYPVFTKWNYSGNYFAYCDFGIIRLQQMQSGKYRIAEIAEDSSFISISDKNNNVIYTDVHGMTNWVCGFEWLTDKILITVEVTFNYDTDDMYDVIIKKHEIKNNYIEWTEFIFKNAFSVRDREILKLTWYEQRVDYFEE